MLERLEEQTRLTWSQKKIIAAAVLGDMLDYFDFGLIGYALAFIVGPWHLTYGQSAMILLTSGIGGVPGALFYGWLADKIGRRTVFILTAFNFSIATGIMAVTPDSGGWIFLSVCRFFVGFGVAGLFTVDLPLVQEFVPTSKRGFVGGLVTSLLPIGAIMGAALGAFVTPVIGWRGLFAIGLLPAAITLLIRAWVPESPRWLIRMGRFDDARRSLAWALEVDPATIELPALAPEPRHAAWSELFRHPRSVVLSCLTNLCTQSGSIGIGLWSATLLVLLLKIGPADASYLLIWTSIAGLIGRFAFSYWSDAIGRKPSGVLLSFGAAASMVVAGYWHAEFIGPLSVFYLAQFGQRFFGDGGYAVVGPYSAEVWPSALRASGMGFGFGIGNFGKIIGPLGLALIVGSSDVISPKATLAAIEPAMYYLAAWYALGGLIFLTFGIETRGRTLEELDAMLLRDATPARAPVKRPA
jgi:MFS transporter, putative metabolite:H+ symporter